LLELLTVIAIIVMIAALLLPAVAKSKIKAYRVQCLNNLKQMGIAFHGFAHEHGDRFPMQVSTNQGGSMEYNRVEPSVGGLFVHSSRHLQILSNDLVTPATLVCRADKRAVASGFALLKAENVSYFTCLNADAKKPASIVAGDWNITDSTSIQKGSVTEGAELQFGWTKQVHEERGNILFADGRVEFLRSFSVGNSNVSRQGASGWQGPVRSAAQRGGSSRPERTRGPVVSAPARGSGTETTASPTATGPPSAKATSISRSTNVTWTVETNRQRVEEWDTENFRLFVTIVEVGYRVSLIWAIVLFLLYILKKRRRVTRVQDTD